MAEHVLAFMKQNNIEKPTLIGHSMYACPEIMVPTSLADSCSTQPQITNTSPLLLRGAKTAMTLALQKPDLIQNFVSVDNAPIDAALNGSFAKYIQGMRKIEEAGVTRQS